VPRRKRKIGRISVFKGQKAKLNHLIFEILALKGPQTIYDIHKEMKNRRGLKYVRYASISKRVRSLKESGYLEKKRVKRTKAGFEAIIYEITSRAYLAIALNSINLDELVKQLDDVSILTMLGIIT
jgi:DNA-binding PadR family transcriptional regulator